MKYEQKEYEIKKSYKWLKISLIVLSMAFLINRFVNYEYRDTGLKEGQMFLYRYGYSNMTFIVKKKVKDGVICTSSDWLWKENLYFSNFDLNFSSSFQMLGMYQYWGQNVDEFGNPIKQALVKSNPLMSLEKYDMFEMVYGSDVITFIVKQKGKNGLICTSTQWLWSTNLWINYSDYNSEYFLKHAVKYPHKN